MFASMPLVVLAHSRFFEGNCGFTTE